MKVVTRKEFLLLPSGTIYALHQPKDDSSCDYFGKLSIKSETWFKDNKDNNEPFDWLYFEPTYLTEIENGKFSQSRDGLYEENQLFAIYDKTDIKIIVDVLQNPLKYL
jgi:hypothetical protein